MGVVANTVVQTRRVAQDVKKGNKMQISGNTVALISTAIFGFALGGIYVGTGRPTPVIIVQPTPTPTPSPSPKPSPSPTPAPTWEPVFSNVDMKYGLWRYPVPGGWVYARGDNGIAFVPSTR